MLMVHEDSIILELNSQYLPSALNVVISLNQPTLPPNTSLYIHITTYYYNSVRRYLQKICIYMKIFTTSPTPNTIEHHRQQHIKFQLLLPVKMFSMYYRTYLQVIQKYYLTLFWLYKCFVCIVVSNCVKQRYTIVYINI